MTDIKSISLDTLALLPIEADDHAMISVSVDQPVDAEPVATKDETFSLLPVDSSDDEDTCTQGRKDRCVKPEFTFG